jgi:serine/threonine protein kinase
MAGAFPTDIPAVLGPGSLLGPGQLGQHYLITDHISTTRNARGEIVSEVFTVEPDPRPLQPCTYALKVCPGGDAARPGWEHEVSVMQRVRNTECPHLAAVRDHFADPATGRLCIVMERYRDSLEGVLDKGRPTARVVWGWAEDMARGLAVLHRPDVGVIHTDLELRNVLVDAQGRAVLGDFGSSLLVRGATTGGVMLYPRGTLKVDRDSAMTAPSVRGIYSALLAGGVAQRVVKPVVEEAFRTSVGPRDDVWALGCVLLQLLLGPARPLTFAMVEHLTRLELPARERWLSEDFAAMVESPGDGEEGVFAERLAGLIARVMTLDPSQRPSAADLLPQPNPDLPRVGARVVVRSKLLERLKQAVLAGGGGAVAVTSQPMNRGKVWGMGGVGKTTLAKMLMDDEAVRTRFQHGVAWVVLGNDVSDVVPAQRMVSAS